MLYKLITANQIDIDSITFVHVDKHVTLYDNYAHTVYTGMQEIRAHVNWPWVCAGVPPTFTVTS